MKLEEQYKKLIELKDEINARLENLDFDKIKELLLWLAGSQDYLKLKNKDNQLIALDVIKDIWLEEKKHINDFEMHGDAFDRVNSLEDVEFRYLKVQFAIFRLENDIPMEYCIEAVQELIIYKYSPLFMFRVIIRETEMIEQNILKLSRLLKNQNDLVRSIGLLKLGVEKYPKNSDFLLELADCWISVQQYGVAYECLNKIANPNKEVRELITELKKVLNNE